MKKYDLKDLYVVFLATVKNVRESLVRVPKTGFDPFGVEVVTEWDRVKSKTPYLATKVGRDYYIISKELNLLGRDDFRNAGISKIDGDVYVYFSTPASRIDGLLKKKYTKKDIVEMEDGLRQTAEKYNELQDYENEEEL